MAPQPAAAQTAETPAPAPHADLFKTIEGTPEDERSSAQKQILRAQSLERDRSDVMKRIAANREYLRLMEENEELEDDEADWLDDFYPQKEKGAQRSEDEVERTRKAKAAARDGGKS